MFTVKKTHKKTYFEFLCTLELYEYLFFRVRVPTINTVQDKNGESQDKELLLSSPPTTIVLFTDFLPPEDVTARSSGALSASYGGGAGGGGAGATPDAVWGAADAIRAVVVPQDVAESVRVVATLDLAVAAAGVAAAAAEEAASFGEIDRYMPSADDGYLYNNGVGSAISLVAMRAGREWEEGGGEGEREKSHSDSDSSSSSGGEGGGGVGRNSRPSTASACQGLGLGLGAVAGTDRPSLIVEAVAVLLGCGRDKVAGIEVVSHGFDLFYNKASSATMISATSTSASSGSPFAASPASASAGAGAAAASPTATATDSGVEANWVGPGGVVPAVGKSAGSVGSVINERASELAGKRVVGDAVVVLVDGGMKHGAAGSGVVDEDGEQRVPELRNAYVKVRGFRLSMAERGKGRVASFFWTLLRCLESSIFFS